MRFEIRILYEDHVFLRRQANNAELILDTIDDAFYQTLAHVSDVRESFCVTFNDRDVIVRQA